MERVKYSIFILPIIILFFFGCSRKTIHQVLPEEELKNFSQSGQIEVPDQWWEAFQNENLNQLVDSALNSNYNLQSAWYRLQEAKAMERSERAGFFPGVEGFGTWQSSESDQAGSSERLELGISTSYELDLWGKIRSRAKAQTYRRQASFFDFQSTALMLSAEVVRTWFELLEARQQVAIARDQIDTNTTVFNLIQSRFNNGQGNLADVMRQEQLLEATREREIVAESRLRVVENRLSVLLGHQPQQQIFSQGDTLNLPVLPPLPSTGIPADLVQRRPDVLRSFELLKAADQDLAASISNLYPRLSISASLSTNSQSAEDLFDNWVRSLAGNVLAPVFYGNRLQAEKDRAKAVKNQRIYEYGQSMLTAFQEVEDALVREKQQLLRVQSLEKQISLSRSTSEQVRSSYLNGVGNYLDALDAMDNLQSLRRQFLSEKLILLEYRVDLYLALAGGFETGFAEEE
jgi:multidrug efflux system outer membrane protein